MNQLNRIILFCDGSAKPNPGFGGYGVYGYIYRYVDKSKKIKHPGNDNLFFTPNGILDKKSDINIEVISIIELIHTVPKVSCTNNEAELLAVISAFEKIDKIDNLEEVSIFTDSNYIVTSFNENLDKWKENNWKRNDSKPVCHIDEWKIIDSYKNKFSNIQITVNWINGHSDNYGNNIADIYSVIGSNSAEIQFKENNVINKVVYESITSYDDYKKSFLTKDIIFFFKDLYFSSNKLDDTNYCFLSSSDNPSITGKRSTSSIFATNIGYVPKIINDIKNLYRSMKRNYTTTCCIKLSRLDNKEIYRLFHLVDIKNLLVKSGSNNHVTYTLIRNSVPFVYEVTSEYPFIVEMSKLFNRTLDIINSNDYIIVKDITDKLIKDNKLLITNKDKILDFSDIFDISIKLRQKLLVTIGYDLPSYLALKSIENDIRQIFLLLENRPDSNYYTLFVNIVLSNRNIYSINIENKYLKSN